MKSITKFIKESKDQIVPATVGDFAKWACLGEEPDGKPGQITDPESCEGLLDNGWFNYFDDEHYEKGCKDIMNFLNDNWDKPITITSHKTPNDWEVSFELDGKEYVAAFLNPFGEADDAYIKDEHARRYYNK